MSVLPCLYHTITASLSLTELLTRGVYWRVLATRAVRHQQTNASCHHLVVFLVVLWPEEYRRRGAGCGRGPTHGGGRRGGRGVGSVELSLAEYIIHGAHYPLNHTLELS
uniref:Uncharacterized protein n=1 Tax=Oryza sativa subsp. japonica TaxID=39947 RepID=Q67V60_ORYSJ|nr:hypothetical protein [Oryza sativa Japonica Group]